VEDALAMPEVERGASARRALARSRTTMSGGEDARSEHWDRCIKEAAAADVVLFYASSGSAAH